MTLLHPSSDGYTSQFLASSAVFTSEGSFAASVVSVDCVCTSSVIASASVVFIMQDCLDFRISKKNNIASTSSSPSSCSAVFGNLDDPVMCVVFVAGFFWSPSSSELLVHSRSAYRSRCSFSALDHQRGRERPIKNVVVEESSFFRRQ